VILTMREQPSTVIDASGLILGRMASVVAKRLLTGESIVVVNAEKAVISGRRLSRVRAAMVFLDVGHPGKGPYHSRRPDQIVRRTVRGMLPRRIPKGQQALGRLHVFLGLPDEFKGSRLETIAEAGVGKLKCPYVSVGDFAREIGWGSVGEAK